MQHAGGADDAVAGVEREALCERGALWPLKLSGAAKADLWEPGTTVKPVPAGTGDSAIQVTR